MNFSINTQQLELFELLQSPKTIKITTKFTFLDLFSGIGGFRIPLEELGGICLGYSEIDKEAIKVYQNNRPRKFRKSPKNSQLFCSLNFVENLI